MSFSKFIGVISGLHVNIWGQGVCMAQRISLLFGFWLFCVSNVCRRHFLDPFRTYEVLGNVKIENYNFLHKTIHLDDVRRVFSLILRVIKSGLELSARSKR